MPLLHPIYTWFRFKFDELIWRKLIHRNLCSNKNNHRIHHIGWTTKITLFSAIAPPRVVTYLSWEISRSNNCKDGNKVQFFCQSNIVIVKRSGRYCADIGLDNPLAKKITNKKGFVLSRNIFKRLTTFCSHIHLRSNKGASNK